MAGVEVDVVAAQASPANNLFSHLASYRGLRPLAGEPYRRLGPPALSAAELLSRDVKAWELPSFDRLLALLVELADPSRAVGRVRAVAAA